MKSYDLIVVGGGPGGYVAAIKAAQLKAKVALVEADRVGGVCLNYGCIPTKTLLRSAKLYQDILNAKTFGIDFTGGEASASINWENLMIRKGKVVDKIVGGVEQLLKFNGIDVYKGFGTVTDAQTVSVNDEILKGKNLIIATGSSPQFPNIEGLQASREAGIVLDSTAAISLKEQPKHVVILGGGVIAVEFATLFNSLGTKVTVLQRSDEILKNEDSDVKALIKRHLEETGVNIITGTSLKKIEGDRIHYTDSSGEHVCVADKILASLGRTPNIKGLEALSLAMTKKGIKIDGHMRTSIPNVYAIGDVCGGMMLAHVASAEGIAAVENIMGKDEILDYHKIPSCIYSFPEVGAVGYTEESAIAAGFEVATSMFPLSANGKAMAEGETTGFVKIISDKKYGEVIGVHIVASHATDMIAEAAGIMALEGTVYDLAKTVHPHPTLSEIVMEAAHGAVDKPIHLIKK
jgi:dihydrolipoamide dehydrogenase